MRSKLRTSCLFLLFLLCSTIGFSATPEIRARTIYQRLTGKILREGSPTYNQMVELAQQGSLFKAGELATSDPSFVDSTLRLWSSRLLNNEDPNLILNDSMAFLLGSVRDNLDARLLLTGDYAYGKDPRMGYPNHASIDNNTIYDELEQQGRPLGTVLYQYSPQWNMAEARETSGILTTRWWAMQNYSAGTNRRTIPAIFNDFMCETIMQWRRPNLPTARIRQDIDRFPQGDARTFQTECRTCHAAMDGMAGAFSKIDFSDNRIKWLSEIAPKYLQHSDKYPDGYVTTDESWIRFLEDDALGYYGWKTPNMGSGMRDLANMIAQSDQFARCMVKRTLKTVCRKDLDVRDKKVIAYSEAFMKSEYKLKDLFITLAISDECQ